MFYKFKNEKDSLLYVWFHCAKEADYSDKYVTLVHNFFALHQNVQASLKHLGKIHMTNQYDDDFHVNVFDESAMNGCENTKSTCIVLAG